MNLFDMVNSKIIIDNVNFLNNSGSYSFFEEEHSLPFYHILTMRQFKLNFFNSNPSNEKCGSEYQSFGDKECRDAAD